jgi:methyl-accepting chemotaxis protein
LKDNPLTNTPLDRDFSQLFNWRNRLKETGNDLYALAALTENEFLSVGSNLQDFYNRATAISELSYSLVNSMSGEEVVNVIDGLRELLKNMQIYIEQTETEFSQGIVSLQSILDIIGNIYKPISGFKKIVKTLKILGISTKIESSQLRRDNNGFVTIADDVEKLSVLINSRFADILGSAGLLENAVKQTLTRVIGLETQQKGKAQSVLQNTEAAIVSLGEKNKSSIITASHISNELETITRNIGEIVSSMQFHDITRQQLEHIKEALDVACSKLVAFSEDKGSLDSSENGNFKKTILDTNTICELQKIQMADAESKFASAVDSIINNLQGIASNIIIMHSDVQNITGNEDESSSSFFSKIESGVLSAISSIKEIKNAMYELSLTMEGLTKTIGEMSKFMNDIEEISSEIQLIAVNARIKAAHTGAEGAPLGIIAEAIQNLSVDASIQKIEISEELKKIVVTVEGLHNNVNFNTDEHGNGTDALLKNLNELLDRLNNTNNAIKPHLNRIENDGKELAHDIERVALDMTVQRTFIEKVEEAKSVLGSIISQTLEIMPEIDNNDKIEALKNLEINYTMHSERNIHRTYMASNEHIPENIPKNMPISDSHIETGDDLGTNVELF